MGQCGRGPQPPSPLPPDPPNPCARAKEMSGAGAACGYPGLAIRQLRVRHRPLRARCTKHHCCWDARATHRTCQIEADWQKRCREKDRDTDNDRETHVCCKAAAKPMFHPLYAPNGTASRVTSAPCEAPAGGMGSVTLSRPKRREEDALSSSRRRQRCAYCEVPMAQLLCTRYADRHGRFSLRAQRMA